MSIWQIFVSWMKQVIFTFQRQILEQPSHSVGDWACWAYHQSTWNCTGLSMCRRTQELQRRARLEPCKDAWTGPLSSFRSQIDVKSPDSISGEGRGDTSYFINIKARWSCRTFLFLMKVMVNKSFAWVKVRFPLSWYVIARALVWAVLAPPVWHTIAGNNIYSSLGAVLSAGPSLDYERISSPSWLL
jgi:hypothetical protein